MNSFIDIGAGLVLSMVHFSPIVFNIKNKQFINFEANDVYNKLFTRAKRLLTDCLHGKAAELWLANS